MLKIQFFISCKNYRIPAKGNQISVEVKSNMEYDVIVGENASTWIQEIAQTKGLSTDVLTFKISENTSANTRSAEILIKSKSNELSDTLRVSQLARGEVATYIGDIIFRTEQDLIDFSSAGYTKVQGNVWVQGLAIHSLKNLDNLLAEIDGSLYLGGEGYVTLEGLRSLKKISKDLIVWTASLKSLEGLENITSIGGNLTINVTVLDSFEGLENLERVGKSLKVNISASFVSFLTTFRGFSKLKCIEENFELSITGGSIWYDETIALKSFEGLENLQTIGGDFKVTASCASLSLLSSFKGLNGLKTIGGSFELNAYSVLNVSSLTGLESFKGLENLESIGGNFKVTTLNSLSSLSALKSFEGLENLKTIGGKKLEISYLNALNNIDAFHNIKVLNDISITGCGNLYDFCALKNAIQSMSDGDKFNISLNGYNPTKEQILNGECSKNPIKQ